MTKRKYDFAGWVTKNDIKCSDGVIIKHDAFRENDGQKVPLVWNHDYNSPNNVLGHVILENRETGVYGYGYFNDTKEGQNANTLVKHGDISSMSVGARKLKRENSNVVKGSIYEVSLVLAGANPGAMIDSVVQHSDDDDEKAIVYTGNLIHSSDDVIDDNVQDDKLKHNVTDDTTIEDIIGTMNDDQKEAVYALLGIMADLSSGNVDAQDPNVQDPNVQDPNVQDVNLQHTDVQDPNVQDPNVQDPNVQDPNVQDPNVQDPNVQDDNLQHANVEDQNNMQHQNNDNKGDDTDMKNNVFNKDKNENQEDMLTLKHSANEVLKLAFSTKASSLRDMLRDNEDVLKHGINSIEMLFPDAYNSTNGNVPIIYKDVNTQFRTILNAINKTPFTRVKTLVADLSEDEARAKGYIKGSMKKEEFFSLIKRVTTPTTVYKKQKLDRDDILDITDFDVVAFMNVEMRMMLEEEIARAVLVGDGRDFSSDEKINEQNIRPIISDNEFFTIHKSFASVSVFIETVIKAMAEYRGSGRPSMYMDPTLLADVKLLKGTDGHFLFGDIPSDESIATRLGLDAVVPTTFMTGKGAIIVNLRDYSLGATKGGQVTTFDQFDIDYNQQKYLIETRLSGALTMPKSAIHLNLTTAGTGANSANAGLEYGSRQVNKYEVASLQITAPVGSSGAGSVAVALNGASTSVTVANSDTAVQVATKIRNATFAGWTTGGTGDTVTFTSTTAGVKADATYSAGSTGATGTMTTSNQGN